MRGRPRSTDRVVMVRLGFRASVVEGLEAGWGAGWKDEVVRVVEEKLAGGASGVVASEGAEVRELRARIVELEGPLAEGTKGAAEVERLQEEVRRLKRQLAARGGGGAGISPAAAVVEWGARCVHGAIAGRCQNLGCRGTGATGEAWALAPEDTVCGRREAGHGPRCGPFHRLPYACRVSAITFKEWEQRQAGTAPH